MTELEASSFSLSKETASMEKEYKRLRKIELLLQQYLFHYEYEDNEKVREEIKEVIEKRLEELKTTNEDKLLVLYHLGMPYKEFNSTKRMIQEYEKLVNVTEVIDRLHKLSVYEQYLHSLREEELARMRAKRVKAFLSEQT